MSENSSQGETVAEALGFPMGTGISQSICNTRSTVPLTAQGLEAQSLELACAVDSWTYQKTLVTLWPFNTDSIKQPDQGQEIQAVTANGRVESIAL